MTFRLWMTLAILVVIGVGLALTFQHPPIVSEQVGFRGTGMVQLDTPAQLTDENVANRIPEPIPDLGQSGTPSSEVYENIQVLGDVDSDEFLRLMTAITEWVSPEEGCAYCHADGEELSSDSLYTKVVARHMIQMTRAINTSFDNHVQSTGVTCYTCHRGQPVPQEIWFNQPERPHARGMAQGPSGQNGPGGRVGLTSLPSDPLTPFFEYADSIRVVSNTALPEGNEATIKQTERTYGLMLHISEALGVNCTFCHNSRSFMDWAQSSPQRTTAYHGIEMVRGLNENHLQPLASVFPSNRLGPLGDVPKISCATCPQGASKPLLGQSMLESYPELARAASASQTDNSDAAESQSDMPSPERDDGASDEASANPSGDQGAAEGTASEGEATSTGEATTPAAQTDAMPSEAAVETAPPVDTGTPEVPTTEPSAAPSTNSDSPTPAQQ
jgi:photosynthetic reaction center cytochrome c subunit